MSANGTGVFDRAEAIRLVDAMRTDIRALEVQYKQAGDNATAAEADYRRQLGAAYARKRDEGKAQDEANVLARAEVVAASEERDRTAHRVKHLAEVLENRRGERASLNRLIDLLVAET